MVIRAFFLRVIYHEVCFPANMTAQDCLGRNRNKRKNFVGNVNFGHRSFLLNCGSFTHQSRI